MTENLLQKKYNKKIRRTESVFFLCTLASLFFIAKDSFFLYKSFEENPINRKSSNHLSKIVLLSTITLFSILFKTSVSELKKIKKKHSDKPSVAKEIIDSLEFPKQTPETKKTQDPLTKEDINRLVRVLDFSKLHPKNQKNLLQNIIQTSVLSPLLTKILKSQLVPATIESRDTLTAEGSIYCSSFFMNKTKISLKNEDDFLSLIHEVFHSKQLADGAFNLESMYHYLKIMNEAHACALGLVLNHHLYQSTNNKDYDSYSSSSYIEKLFKNRLNAAQRTQNHQSPLMHRIRAEEETIGIIAKCLISNSILDRKKIIQSYTNYFDQKDHLQFSCLCDAWRMCYITDLIKEYEDNLEKNTDSFTVERRDIPLFNQYYTSTYHAPIELEDIMLSNDKHQNFLKRFTEQEKQNQR